MTDVELVEVGPRDGLQNESRALPVSTRVALVERLVAAGVRRLETVSFVRPDRVPQMADAEGVMAAVPDVEGVTYVGLVLNGRGAQRAVQTRCDEINIVVPVTDAFATRNQGASVEALLDQAGLATQVARDAGRTVSVTLAVAFGCPFSGEVPLDRVAQVLEPVLALGVDEIAFGDTIGVGDPVRVQQLASLVPATGPGLRFHFHNTRNTGYVNAWAAVSLGRDVALDASVGGFGGCPFAPAATGNIGTEDLLYLLGRSGVELSGAAVDVAALTATATWLQGQLDSPVQALLGRAGGFGAGFEQIRAAQ